MKTLHLDDEGRIALPKDVQDALGIEPGDDLAYIIDCGVLFLSIADVPMDKLIAEAEAEYKAGKTISAREYARQRGFSIDGE